MSTNLILTIWPLRGLNYRLRESKNLFPLNLYISENTAFGNYTSRLAIIMNEISKRNEPNINKEKGRNSNHRASQMQLEEFQSQLVLGALEKVNG